jgi:hypothetical protein
MSRHHGSQVRGRTPIRGSNKGSASSTPLGSQNPTPIGSRHGSPANSAFPRAVTPPPVDDNDAGTLPIIISPIKKRAQHVSLAIKKLPDVEVWDMDDDDILSVFCLCIMFNIGFLHSYF